MSEPEEIIKKHRDAFDLYEPSDGHKERFELKLQKRSREKKSRDIFWRVAAAAIIFMVVAVSVWMPRQKPAADVQLSALALGDISEELATVESYYSSKLNAEKSQLEAHAKTDIEAAALLNELDRLEEQYAILEKELYSSGGHDKVIASMIENFRLRLELTKKIKIKETKTTQNN